MPASLFWLLFPPPRAARRAMGGLEECPDISIEMFISDNCTVKTVNHDLICASSITLYRKWFSVSPAARPNKHFGLGFQFCLPLIWQAGRRRTWALLSTPLSPNIWWLSISPLTFPCVPYQTTRVFLGYSKILSFCGCNKLNVKY